MKLNQRQFRLVSILLKQKGYTTIKFYADELKCSERTIHSDLKLIEQFLSSKGYELEKKSGVGIRANKVERTPPIVEVKQQLNDYSTSGRRRRIMELLLFEHKTVTYDGLSELFLVSRTSIKNDLDFVEKKLTGRNNLQLLSDSQGTRLAGKEKDLQKAYMEFNRYVLEDSNMIFESDDKQKLMILEAYYGKDVVSVCSRVLYGYVKNDVTAIAEYYVFNVLSMMIILVYRLMRGHHLGEQRPVSGDQFESAYFKQSAEGMLDKISLRLNVEYKATDVEYLASYLISNKFAPLPSESKYALYVDRIMKKAGDSLHLDFTKDQKLKEQLLHHFPPMIYRLRARIHTSNPLIGQIKNEFPLIFNVIWVVLSEYEDELGVIFNEEEVGFLTIYFQSAIERAKIGKKILVICPRGIATSELLGNRIKNVLPAFDMIEVASVKEAAKLDLKDIDLIISTVETDLPESKVIVVSPLLSEQDMKNISDLYYDKFVLAKEGKNEMKPLPDLGRYLKDEFIIFDGNFQSKDELIDDIGSKLVAGNFVTESFMESLKNRELMGGTDLPTGAAIPHGNPKYVNETMIVFVRNKRNIIWHKHSVRTVIFICFAEKDTRKIKHVLSDIYWIVENKEMLNQIYMMSDKEEFKKWIGSGSY
ncbi:BglG family transcription antiterminator [Paenibacillus fonticola]|uniref:BglG family transcription antiterminator n=1 Tax=Paenibacillus fonticola TaxID=379896 RepID=UPI000367AC9A|nr:PTS sugar transporter subunit IIA [Paenibacillus fonticola]